MYTKNQNEVEFTDSNMSRWKLKEMVNDGKRLIFLLLLLVKEVDLKCSYKTDVDLI